MQEVVRRERCEPVVERDDEDHVRAEVATRNAILSSSVVSCWRGCDGVTTWSGSRSKVSTHAAEFRSRAMRDRVGHERLVADVHAVEDADGDHGRAELVHAAFVGDHGSASASSS